MGNIPLRIGGRIGSARIALLTITTEEFGIVSEAFAVQQNLPATPYFMDNAQDAVHPIVICRSSAQTNLVAAETVREIIEDFRPDFILLIGTAGGYGGRDELKLGDVVVAEYVEHSGYWKYKQGQVLQRKIAHDHPSLFLLDGFVEALRADPSLWRKRIAVKRPKDGEALLLRGEIVAGDRLYGDPDNPEQKRILEYFDKALAFEMEAVGLARTVYRARRSSNYNPQFLVIRGISDLVNEDAGGNQQTRNDWTPYAVSSACAVATVLVERMLHYFETQAAQGGAVASGRRSRASLLSRFCGIFRRFAGGHGEQKGHNDRG
jgi:nucleoside phosphorylase